MKELPLPVFIINLNKRVDRKENIVKEFEGKQEFYLTFVEPLEHVSATSSLWNTIRNIIKNCSSNYDFVIICEDDHQFTTSYTKEFLLSCIASADECNSDILSGGVSCIGSSCQITKGMFWMEKFTGLQFTIIFRRFFDAILNFQFVPNHDADIVISDIASKKFVMYPFISTQKEFGYSDVTPRNNLAGRVEELFVKSGESVKVSKEVKTYYETFNNYQSDDKDSFEDIFISTYIVSVLNENNNLAKINEQFENRKEFDVKIIKPVKHQKENLNKWLTIRQIINLAIVNDDDIILICEGDHVFTENYKKETFLKNIIQAHLQGTDILLGCTSEYGNAVLVADDKFWINRFVGTHFIVIYKKIFQNILDEPFDETVITDKLLSEIASNKVVLFPFISEQQSSADGEFDIFAQSKMRLKKMLEIDITTSIFE